MREHTLALLLVLTAATQAHAKERLPATSSLHWEEGNDQNIVAGVTFGLLVSHDGGVTWNYMCEAAVGYGGIYDPAYSYSQSGAIFANVFNGLTVNRDGCTFAATSFGTTLMSWDVLGSDHALYVTASDPADGKIYKSTDDGATFPTSTTVPLTTGCTTVGAACSTSSQCCSEDCTATTPQTCSNSDWWETLLVAPSNASVSYLAGFRFVHQCDASSVTPGSPCSTATDCQDATHSTATCESARFLLLFKSVDGSSTFSALPGNHVQAGMTSSIGLTTSASSIVDFVGVSPTNPSIVYARVTYENPDTPGDGVYRLDTSLVSPTWVHLVSKEDSIAFLAQSNGRCVIGTQTLGAASSTDCETAAQPTWTALTNPPHINCLYEAPTTHDVWACTNTYDAWPDAPPIPSDGFGIMKSADLTTWNGVLRYQDIAGPVSCPAGTVQHDTCATTRWCALKPLFGLTSMVVDCDGADSPPDAGTFVNKTKTGGCNTGSTDGPTTVMGVAVVIGVLLVRRRRATVAARAAAPSPS